MLHTPPSQIVSAESLNNQEDDRLAQEVENNLEFKIIISFDSGGMVNCHMIT